MSAPTTLRGPVHAPNWFMAKVEVGPGCWRWTASANTRTGYPQIKIDGQVRPAYQVAYELFVGLIPEGRELDHACHTRDTTCPGGDDCPHRRCVNPAHLEPVSHRENIARSRHPAAGALRTNQCLWGHEFTPANTRMRSDGSRVCKECARRRCREWRKRRAA